VGILSRQRPADLDRASPGRAGEIFRSLNFTSIHQETKNMSTSDKIKGVANEVAGKAKQAAGAAINDPELRAKGALQEAKGSAQKAKGDAKDAVKKIVDRA
jgi:uncharacterized protein YjbJ (UPF0337 family)